MQPAALAVLGIVLLVCTLGLVAAAAQPLQLSHLVTVAYLSLLTAILVRVTVELPRGRMNLTAIAAQAAGMLLPVQLAPIVGVGSVIFRLPPHGSALGPAIRAISFAFWTTLGAAVHQLAIDLLLPLWFADLLVVICNSVSNWAVIALALSLTNGEPVVEVLRRNFTSEWTFVFGAFGAASMVMAHTLRGGDVSSYAYASLVPVLAVALRSHLTLGAIQPTLRASVRQVSEQSQYVGELEGAIHDLRNVLMTASVIASTDPAGDLRPVLEEALDVSRRGLAHQVSASAFRHLELRQLLARADLIARPVANAKQLALATDLPAEGIPVFGDAVLLVELLTNLMLNAIDVSPSGTIVRVTCRINSEGERAISISDSGPGFAAGESLETTAFGASSRSTGHGIGLRWSQTVALQHLGRLVLEGSGPTGSIITLHLRPPGEVRRRLLSLDRATHGGGTTVPPTRGVQDNDTI